MFLISQNIESYDIELPDDAVFRINLAWCNSIQELENKTSEASKREYLIVKSKVEALEAKYYEKI